MLLLAVRCCSSYAVRCLSIRCVLCVLFVVGWLLLFDHDAVVCRAFFAFVVWCVVFALCCSLCAVRCLFVHCLSIIVCWLMFVVC